MPTRTIFKLHSITLLIITLSDPHHFLFLLPGKTCQKTYIIVSYIPILFPFYIYL